MPSCGCWTSFCFTIANHTSNDKVGVIHHGAKGDTEGIPQFSTFTYAS
jgi:hypothetical protein